jgi:succinyl-CoA synthetase beta subunit
MNIHEYQAKQILKSYGAPVADGVAILKADEAQNAARSLPGPLYVVKSQIHAGGRGKGKFKELPADAKGGVRLAKSIDEVEHNAKEMLGNTLVTCRPARPASRSTASTSRTARTSIKRVLPLGAGRPRDRRPHRLRRLDRGRHGHREAGA